LIVEIVKYGI